MSQNNFLGGPARPSSRPIADEGPEGAIEQAVWIQGMTRDSFARLYADALCDLQDGRPVDFSRINEAILTRYAPSGLAYIKALAWKLFEARQ